MAIDITQLQEVIFQEDGGVVTLTLNRPAKRNAITSLMLAELIFCLERCDRDATTRVVVLRGTGKGFCPGDDLAGMGDTPAEFLSELDHPVTHAAIQECLRGLGKPTVAAIHGYAFGVGLDLGMACDFRIAADSTQLRDQRVMERGMHALTGCAWFQPRAIGLTRALEFLILGKPYNGPEAAAAGMITQSVKDEDFDQAVTDFTANLANAPTKAIGLMKRQIYAGLELNHAQFMEFAAPLMQEVEIKDRQEGIQAFLDKRPARFSGD